MFHLAGKGNLMVQAEAGPDGAVSYGVIDRHKIRAAPGGEMGKVRPPGTKDE